MCTRTIFTTHTIAEGRDLLFMDPSRNYQFPPNYDYIILNSPRNGDIEILCISRSGNPYITSENETVSTLLGISEK